MEGDGSTGLGSNRVPVGRRLAEAMAEELTGLAALPGSIFSTYIMLHHHNSSSMESNTTFWSPYQSHR